MSNSSAGSTAGFFAPAGSGAWYCKRRHLLRELPGRLAERLRSRASLRNFQSGDLLFTSSGTEGVVHLVVEGRVRLVRFDPDGGETQLAVLEPGEAVREPRHGEVEPIPLYAEGIAPGSVLSLEFADLRELVAGSPRELAALGTAID